MCVGPQHHYPDDLGAATAATTAKSELQKRVSAAARQLQSGATAAQVDDVSAAAQVNDGSAPAHVDAVGLGAGISAMETPVSTRPQGRLIQQVRMCDCVPARWSLGYLLHKLQGNQQKTTSPYQ